MIRGAIHVSTAMESLSRGYVECVAADAGCTTESPIPDVDGVDIALRQRTTNPTHHTQIDIQLKSTAMAPPGADFPHRLEAAHYNDLCLPFPDQLAVPRILVVYLVASNRNDWLLHDPTETRVRHAAYWVSLMGRRPTTQQTKTVTIPLAQPFTVDGLCDLLQLRRERHWP